MTGRSPGHPEEEIVIVAAFPGQVVTEVELEAARHIPDLVAGERADTFGTGIPWGEILVVEPRLKILAGGAPPAEIDRDGAVLEVVDVEPAVAVVVAYLYRAGIGKPRPPGRDRTRIPSRIHSPRTPARRHC